MSSWIALWSSVAQKRCSLRTPKLGGTRKLDVQCLIGLLTRSSPELKLFGKFTCTIGRSKIALTCSSPQLTGRLSCRFICLTNNFESMTVSDYPFDYLTILLTIPLCAWLPLWLSLWLDPLISGSFDPKFIFWTSWLLEASWWPAKSNRQSPTSVSSWSPICLPIQPIGTSWNDFSEIHPQWTS